MFLSQDTIIAVATPPGRGALGIVRISGPEATNILAKHFRTSGRFPEQRPREAIYGRLCTKDRELDEVLVTFFKAPHSYTGEDLIEIGAHGNPLILQQILETFARSGARHALPGEFTFRAFRSGRIDLAQSEAVNDLIAADTVLAGHLALRSLRGELSGRLGSLRERLDSLLIRIETLLEFEDQDTGLSESVSDFEEEIGPLLGKTRELAEASARQRKHGKGIVTVLCGCPNVGKSTLLNRILLRERALVSPEPGTTRDTLEEPVEIDGLPFLFIDTAGLRREAKGVEAMGVERTREAISRADAAFFLFDLFEGINENDLECLSELRKNSGELMVFPLGNKADRFEEKAPAKAEALEAASRILGGMKIFPLSAVRGDGVPDALKALREWAGHEDVMAEGAGVWINARQGLLLEEASSALEKALRGCRNGLTLDLLAEELHLARHALAELTGEKAPDNLLERIFSRFCIGK